MSDGGQMFLVSREHMLHFKQMGSIKMLIHYSEFNFCFFLHPHEVVTNTKRQVIF